MHKINFMFVFVTLLQGMSWAGFLVFYRLQLIPDEDLGSLYDLLIDDPPEIRRAIGALVYDHLIDQSSRTGLFALRATLFFKKIFYAKSCE